MSVGSILEYTLIGAWVLLLVWVNPAIRVRDAWWKSKKRGIWTAVGWFVFMMIGAYALMGILSVVNPEVS